METETCAARARRRRPVRVPERSGRREAAATPSRAREPHGRRAANAAAYWLGAIAQLALAQLAGDVVLVELGERLELLLQFRLQGAVVLLPQRPLALDDRLAHDIADLVQGEQHLAS